MCRSSIEKTDGEYKTTICRLILRMRQNDDLPWHWIADHTRWMRLPAMYRSLKAFMTEMQTMYGRDFCRDLHSYIEVWLAKDALAGFLYPETEAYGVPLMVTRGYPSATFLYEASHVIADQEKPCFIYQFGDHDPSGVGIAQTTESRLREFAPDADFHFARVAVTPEQIAEYSLPTRPTKQTDSRARNFKGESVDVDAIAPGELRRLCRDCIERHTDRAALARTKTNERAEREAIEMLNS